MARYVLARTLHDAGLAAWCGGSLMGAVGLNGAAARVDDPAQRSRAATIGWSRWAPVNAAAVGAHLFGAARLLAADRRRIKLQRGVATGAAVKTALTAAAVGVTAYSGVLNRKMAQAGDVPARGATEPGASTPPDVARTQQQLRLIQWAIPALTGGLVAVSALETERMRLSSVVRGVFQRLVLQPLVHPGTSSVLVLLTGAAAAALLRRRSSSSRRPQDQSQGQPGPAAPRVVALPDTPTATTSSPGSDEAPHSTSPITPTAGAAEAPTP